MLLLTLFTFPCLSQTIGNWTFNNTLAGTGGTYNSVANADFSGSIPSKVFNGSGEYYGEDGWPAGAVNTGSYLQFSISPNTGYQLDLSSIVLRIRRSNTGSPAGSGPTAWSLRSSLDGFTTDIASNSLVHTYTNYTVPLGSAFLQVYSTVTFRLYGYNVSINSGGLSRLVLDNISIQGIGAVLPVHITGIQAIRSNANGINVKWQMSQVQEGTVFKVQRSTNGIDYTTINTYTEKEFKATYSYNYSDVNVPAVYSKLYYRVQGQTPDGRTFLSPIVRVSKETATQAVINHASIQGELLYTSLQTPETGCYTISVVAMNGAVLKLKRIELEAGVHGVTLPLPSLSRGTYLIRLTGNGIMTGKKIVW
ncbi:hypothetical protein [Longitalea luteola]|uniref:hypothetical protein n=1 Tax=Longitalea luteola TaxID=2812563 RepID=UPI001A960A1D|nr:hypothetical protein [Longitalea luteola]